MKTVKYIVLPNGKKIKVTTKKSRNLMLENLVNDFSSLFITQEQAM